MFKLRNLPRLLILVVCAGLALGFLPEHWVRWSVALPALSPLLGVGGALALRSATLLTLLALPLLVLPLFLGRFFCWRLCPMGFVAESVSRLRRGAGGGLLRQIPFVGKGLALILLGSAAVGYPLFIWLDPLSIFNGFFAAWHRPFTWMSATTAIGFVSIVVLSLALPNIWCHRLCPLGGVEEWLTHLGRWLRQRHQAEASGESVLTRAKGGRRLFLGLALGGVGGALYRAFSARMAVAAAAREALAEHSGSGGGCGRGAGRGLGRGLGGGRGRGVGRGLGRRHEGGTGECGCGAGAHPEGHYHEEAQCGGVGGVADIEHTCHSSSAAVHPIRPPGAVSSGFNALCARCGNCMQACPYDLIQPDMGLSGIDGLFTPTLNFRSKNSEQEQFCFQECVACSEVCPTGALTVLDMVEKQQRAIGLATVCRKECVAWGKQEYCVVCQEYCPYQAIIEVERGGVVCPIVDIDKCRGCGACESQCPAQPIAIVVRGRIPQLRLTDPSPQLDPTALIPCEMKG